MRIPSFRQRASGEEYNERTGWNRVRINNTMIFESSHLVSGGEILAAGEARAGPGGGIPPRREHRNSSVLQLDAPEVIESLPIAIGDVTEGIPAPELGRGRADLVVERSVEGGGALAASLGGGKGGGAGEEGG